MRFDELIRDDLGDEGVKLSTDEMRKVAQNSRLKSAKDVLLDLLNVILNFGVRNVTVMKL